MAVETIIQSRRDTSANWSATNPVLAAGEIGFASDTNCLKVGDGSTAWNTLQCFAPVADFNATPQLLAGNINAYALPDDSGMLIVNNAGNVNFRGIVAKPDGFVLNILNVGINRVRIQTESTAAAVNAAAADRFGGVGNKDIQNGELMQIIYNGTLSRWITPWN